jgi:hypothetical protein
MALGDWGLFQLTMEGCVMWWTTLIGFAIGCWYSYNSIFLDDFLRFGFSVLTTGHILYIVGGGIFPFVTAWFGYMMGKMSKG